jgi:KipI family sensor histidine kinase inhibitor
MLKPLGDAAVLITLDTVISPAANARVHALAARIQAQGFGWLRALVPAYASLTVHYDPLHADWQPGHALWSQLTRLLEPLCAELSTVLVQGRQVDIPVLYDGPDLSAVAEHTGLSINDVVLRHTAPEYRVYFLGFMPGFPYLGGLDPQLATPRLATPRARVPAGAVAIGGGQTGIYPMASPGGWRLLGRTPLRLFDPARAQPCLLAPGDRLRFQAIDAERFAELAGASPC